MKEKEITLSEIQNQFAEVLEAWKAKDFKKEVESATEAYNQARKFAKECDESQHRIFEKFRAIAPDYFKAGKAKNTPEYEEWQESVYKSARADENEKHKLLCKTIAIYWEERQTLFFFLHDLINDEKIMNKAETTPARYKRYENMIKPLLEQYQLRIYYDEVREQIALWTDLRHNFTGEYQNEHLNAANISQMFKWYLAETPPTTSIEEVATACEKAHEDAERTARAAAEKLYELRKIYRHYIEESTQTLYY